MTSLAINGREVRVTTPERVLWPAVGFTKAEMIDYYVQAADALLPHIADRPLTLHRFPEGIGGPHFYQTRTPPHPSWLRTVTLHYERTGKTFAAPVIDDLAGLVWAANLSTVEIHPFLGRVSDVDTPLVAVFDLDPGPPAGLLDAAVVAMLIREAVRPLSCQAKTSGAAGMHVYVPLNTAVTYDAVKAFARSVAGQLTATSPNLVVDKMTRSLRAGKVFVDWSQNDRGKSTVAPYSLRGLRAPTVSTPVTWDEVATAVGQGDAGRLAFRPADVLARLERHGDLFAPVLSTAQHLAE